MNGHAARDRRHARIGALSDLKLSELIGYLCGAVPEVVDEALDNVESGTGDGTR